MVKREAEQRQKIGELETETADLRRQAAELHQKGLAAAGCVNGDQIAEGVLALLPALDGVDQADSKVDQLRQAIAALVAEAAAAAATQAASQAAVDAAAATVPDESEEGDDESMGLDDAAMAEALKEAGASCTDLPALNAAIRRKAVEKRKEAADKKGGVTTTGKFKGGRKSG